MGMDFVRKSLVVKTQDTRSVCLYLLFRIACREVYLYVFFQIHDILIFLERLMKNVKFSILNEFIFSLLILHLCILMKQVVDCCSLTINYGAIHIWIWYTRIIILFGNLSYNICCSSCCHEFHFGTWFILFDNMKFFKFRSVWGTWWVLSCQVVS